MAREFVIPSETLVKVKGGAHFGSRPIAILSELGLTSEEIRITPRFYHRDVPVDDFGRDEAPPEVRWGTAVVDIPMTLIHFDTDVLELCFAESMGGGRFIPGGGLPTALAGTFPPAGRPMGAGLPLFSSGNHLISLSFVSALGAPWRFRAAYLTQTPFVYPLGTKAAAVDLNWRCIPYVSLVPSGVSPSDPNLPLFRTNEVLSSGAVLWDYETDT